MTTTRHRKRYERDRRFPTIRLTERDRKILRYVLQYRLLDSRQIAALVDDGSERKVAERLQKLWQNHYLDRPDVQKSELYEVRGTPPMVYALGRRGAEFLNIPYLSKNRTIKYRFYKHTLLVSSILVAFELACRAHGNLRFIPWSEIFAASPEKTKTKDRPQTLGLEASSGRSLDSITPDAVFGLQVLDRGSSGSSKTYFYLLEADRATEPERRRRQKGRILSDISLKLEGYSEVYRRKLCRQYGIERFSVLFVTTGAKGRVSNMVTTAKAFPRYHRLFLFIDAETFFDARDPFEVPWINGNGEPEELIR